ncbi:SMP-30/gluconolactonase/LRE family protein [Ferroplasma sp.]|uniref:SMP-30/gluconolactonase/LRE family protein n=1 Tax=Ferroplasma sp. TaxID=2591003 RepID=UPI00307D0FA2
MKAKVIKESPSSKLGESPVWKDGILYYVDIFGGKIYSYNGNISTVYSDKIIPFIVPCDDGLIFATKEEIKHLKFNGNVTTIFHMKFKDNVRFNDGKCDMNGILYAGTMDMNEKEPDGSLYRFDSKEKAVLDNITISNGTIWNYNKKVMYYIDSPTRKIRVFDYDTINSSIISEKESIDVSSFMGVPDGMTIDVKGNLYVAFHGGSCVMAFDGSGNIIKKIYVGAKNVDSCVFGGEDMKTLYITTAMDENGNGGKLYKFKNDIPGIPSEPFRFSIPE